MNIKIPTLIMFLVLSGTMLSACKFQTAIKQADAIDRSVGIRGQVSNASNQEGDIWVKLYKVSNDKTLLVEKRLVALDGQFFFPVLAGEYMVAAFVDSNANGVYESPEPTNFYSAEDGVPLHFVLEAADELALETLDILPAGANPVDHIAADEQVYKFIENIGKVSLLDEPMFSRQAAKMGVWRPIDYLNEYGGGLVMLQEYDANKTPVIFVHGIFGTALDFSTVLSELDTNKFQPWVLQYPSGLHLPMVSDYLLAAISEMQGRHQFDQVIVVAHSMGGLVVRAFVKQYTETDQRFDLAMVMTINSPLRGMKSASIGVQYSPIVVPAWRDLEPDSAFIQKIHSWKWPDTIPYHLVFSYMPGHEGDTVVPLSSQLSRSLQEEAVEIYGFEGEHAPLLHQDEFIQQFNEIMQQYPQP